MDSVFAPDRVAQWLAVIPTSVKDIAARHPSLYASLQPALRYAYDAAGRPYGGGEKEMLSWWQERTAVERGERPSPRQRR